MQEGPPREESDLLERNSGAWSQQDRARHEQKGAAELDGIFNGLVKVSQCF